MMKRLSCSVLNFVYNPMGDNELAEISLNAMEIIKKAGFSQVELYLRRDDPDLVNKIARKLKETDLIAPTVHFHKPMLERGLNYALEKAPGLITAASSLGARQGIVHPPIKLGYHKGVRETIAFLEKVVPLAANHGLAVSLETMPIEKSDLFLVQIARCFSEAEVQITIDLKFQTASGIPLERFFESLPGRISNIHVNDFAGFLLDEEGRRRYPFPGSGTIDFGLVGKIFKRYGYRGLLTLETSLEGFEDRLSSLLMAKEILWRLGDVD